MPLTAAQDKLYWRTVGRLGKALKAQDPGMTPKEVQASRVYWHKSASCPESHTAWQSLHLTRFLAYADIVADPDDISARMRLAEALNDNAPLVFLLNQQLRAMRQDLRYAAGCVPDGASLPHDPCKWPAEALKTALSALKRTHKRAQLPGKDPF